MSEGWKPIETAPKNVAILVANPDSGPQPIIGLFIEEWGEWRRDDMTSLHPAPTVWRPLPDTLAAAPEPPSPSPELNEALEALRPFAEWHRAREESYRERGEAALHHFGAMPDDWPVAHIPPPNITMGHLRRARSVVAKHPDNIVGEYRFVTCDECDGAGEWDEGPINTRGSPCIPADPEYCAVKCPECGGSGKVEREVFPAHYTPALRPPVPSPDLREALEALRDLLATGLNGGNNVRLAYIAAGGKALSDELLTKAEKSEAATQRARAILAKHSSKEG
jgi:hypothetical protein